MILVMYSSFTLLFFFLIQFLHLKNQSAPRMDSFQLTVGAYSHFYIYIKNNNNKSKIFFPLVNK